MEREFFRFEPEVKGITSSNTYLLGYNLTKEDIILLTKTLDESEFDIFREVLESFKIGSFHLCLMGLRSIIDHILSKICTKKGIPLEFIKKNGKKGFLGLWQKYKKVENDIKKPINKSFLSSLIYEGHETTHDIDQKKRYEDVIMAIRSFLRCLEEEIFLK